MPVRRMTAPQACYAEAEQRICNVLDPYISNMCSRNEGHLIGIIKELKDHLIDEFWDFGFPVIDIEAQPQEVGPTK